MSRVIVLEPVTKDIRSAEHFGEIVYLFDKDDPRPSIWDTPEYLLAVQERLEKIEFNGEQDYFAAAGALLALVSVTTLLSQLYPSFRVLFFHAQIQEYVSRTFSAKDYNYAG